MLEQWIDAANGVLWGSILIYLLVGCGVWFTFRLGLIQVRHFTHMFTLLKGSRHADEQGISPFQALSTSLAARVGTGNLMGVAVAITLGGPGAIFWMWLIAFIGMATAYAESTLGQVYKEKDHKGNFRGGPAYYMSKGLKNRYMAILFSLCLFFGYGFVFSAVQAYSITDAFNGSFGIEPLVTGAVITFFSAIIVFGGLKSIARFAELTVPVMGIAYILVALVVVLLNLEHIPAALMNIIAHAFGWQEAAGGTVGAAMINGIKRGLYSNEAGQGSAPNVAAAAVPYPNHPASQGYIQMSAVFFDTILICTGTALIILLAAPANIEAEGIQFTQQALAYHVGDWGSYFITFAILLFAFTSIVGNFAYAENNLKYLGLDTRAGHWFLRIVFLAMLLYGSSSTLGEMISLADFAIALMTIVNVIALFMLSKVVVNVTKDYQAQKQQGKLPEYQVTEETEKKLNLTKGIWR
ncbi:alanine/glycine:cation symporter family protein [Thalassotalea agarivorans]|uniref:Alanine or glycine:cation symporter, AGCS family n=1 Tax=Thalassotalea agarivorans TaxID=349064 RepID=A0A1I0GSC2_THASX|nr:alanine/glycine:cation symporter family protein [Thalassotalea agarivorans]SET74234.1 alanine or glycine:cation symporter, AGCS family [Thalassotalea agarivorans]